MNHGSCIAQLQPDMFQDTLTYICAALMPVKAVVCDIPTHWAYTQVALLLMGHASVPVETDTGCWIDSQLQLDLSAFVSIFGLTVAKLPPT